MRCIVDGDGVYYVYITVLWDWGEMVLWLDMQVIDGAPIVLDYQVERWRISDEARHEVIAQYLRAGRKRRKEWRDDDMVA